MPPESTYGNKGFVVPFHDLINCYKTSRSDCTVKSVYHKKGGTLRYTSEVCYVIMVIMEEDNQDGYFSTLPSMFEEPCFEHNGCIDREGKIVNNETPYFRIKHPFSSWDCWESLAFAFVFLIQDQLPLQCPKQFCEEVEVNHVRRCTSTQPHPRTKEWVCPNLIQQIFKPFLLFEYHNYFFKINYIIKKYIYIFFFLKMVTKIWVQLSFISSFFL